MKENGPILSWPVEALPVIRLAGRFPLDERGFGFIYRGPAHVLHVHGYSGRVRLGDATFSLQPGDVTLSPAEDDSAYDLDRPGLHWCIHFQPDSRRGAAMNLPLHLRTGAGRDFPAQQMARVAQLHATAMMTRPADPLAGAAAAVAFQELLLWLAMQARQQASSPPDSRGRNAVERLAGIIESRLSEPLTVPALADEVELSQNHLARLFRRRFGMTIPHYLLTRRIAQARHLLISTNIPIREVASRVGLPDARHFNKQFRKLTGGSPSRIRAAGLVRASL